MFKDRQYDLLAGHFEKHLDMDTLAKILCKPLVTPDNFI